MKKKYTLVTIITIILVSMSIILVPFTPENAVRLKMLSSGYISNVFLSKILLTQDMGPYQHCTYYPDSLILKCKKGYRVTKIDNTPWYVAEEL